MDATATPPPSWLQARAKHIRKQRRAATANVFKGQSGWEQGDYAGVDVWRLSVSPDKALPVPVSFAVVDESRWSACADTDKLPVQLKWQQSNDGRFDFHFPLPTGMSCFGLGERLSGLNLRSNIHTLVNVDNPHHNDGMDSMYKSIPFLILHDKGKCTGIFLDSPAPQRWDLDSDLSQTALIELWTRRGFQLYVIGPTTLPQVVAAYTTLTGRHALPPLWSLGHQQSRWSYPDEDTIREVTAEYRKRNIPCDTMVMDIDYMEDYRVFTYSRERFASFPSLAAELGAQSFKLITIIDPGVKIDDKYVVYKEAVDKELICYTADGKPFVEKVWPGDCVFPDFVKPETRDWWARQHDFYVNAGIAGIWNDMNEPAFFEKTAPLADVDEEMPPAKEQRFLQTAPEGEVGHLEVRNLYGMMMARASHDGLVALRPDERPFVLTRSGYAGLQRYSAVWLGDNMSWFEHLEKSIPMLLNMGLSGVTFAGVDIGGFGGNCDAELLVRWYETGIFYPFFRNHCALNGVAQEPWAFGEQAEKLSRRLIEWRYRLLPYINTLFWEHARTGAPLMRPLVWHYPADTTVTDIDDQFMFGSDIMVAPITVRGHYQRQVYFPEGLWHCLDDNHPDAGKPLEGGRVHIIAMPPGTVPAFVRDGAIIPLADVVQSTADYQETPVRFQVFGTKAQGKIIFDDGISLDYKQGNIGEYELVYDGHKVSVRTVCNGFKPEHKFYVVVGKQSSSIAL